MRIIEINLEDVDLTEEKIQVNFSEVKIYMIDQNPYQGQYQNNSYQGNNYEDIITHTEISNRAIIMVNLEAESWLWQR